MNHPGNTDFDVKDRLAIINLCNAYANHFDKNELGDWFTLFTENPTCVICLSDEPPVTVIGDDFKNLLSQYREFMVEAGTQPLHLDTNLVIQEQDPNRAKAEAYIMYMPLEIAAFNLPEKSFLETRITGTARYTWSLLKGDDGIWRIDSYRIAYLQKVVEATAH
ncbi:nuclear transport factor 2 family protein [Luminiphilus sp.]|nr:nuclear transport factor 2 family protein [Luminiphilus sp.]